MNELRGNDFLLQVEDPGNAGQFLTLGGLKTNSMSLNGEAVDVTRKGTNGWRKIMEAGVNSIDFSAEGVTEKVNTFKIVLEAWVNKVHLNYRLSMTLLEENVLQITTRAKLTTLEFSGENDKEVPYSFSFMQSDEPDIQIF